MMMSDQPENAMEPAETRVSEGVRQYILARLDASKQTIAELSDEELHEVAGGILGDLVGLTALGGYIWNRIDKNHHQQFNVVIRNQTL
jgi:hypothetical protein